MVWNNEYPEVTSGHENGLIYGSERSPRCPNQGLGILLSAFSSKIKYRAVKINL